ncbi:MAG: hypothetical protein NZ455_00765 [Bacteroidia bacterium]|nr:hypothetical protein [Bacteroidia bacterium]
MEENLPEIQTLIKEYPYYALLYFKQAKILANSKNTLYKDALKLASIYAPNRRKLQEFIENPTDYRRQIVSHSEWLSEDRESQNQTETLPSNHYKELIEEILNPYPTDVTPISTPETPIVKQVQEIQQILSQSNEEDTYNPTIEYIQKLKQSIQQNQEKARLALFQNQSAKKKQDTALQDNTQDTSNIQQNNIDTVDPIYEPIEKNNLSDNLISQNSSENVTALLNTETEQEPVSLSVPKMKEWFEQELKAVREAQAVKQNETETQNEQEKNIVTSETQNMNTLEAGLSYPIYKSIQEEKEEKTVNQYLSWLEEMILKHNSEKSQKTQLIQDKKTLQNQIIDRFLESQPKISKPDPLDISITENKTEHQTVEYEDIASETLAKIFVIQKQYSRAIRIYQALISKNPSQKEHYEAVIKDIEAKMS